MLTDVNEDDDDDDDMTKKENRPRPRVSDVSESIFGLNHVDVLILFRQIKFENYFFSMKYVIPFKMNFTLCFFLSVLIIMLPSL